MAQTVLSSRVKEKVMFPMAEGSPQARWGGGGSGPAANTEPTSGLFPNRQNPPPPSTTMIEHDLIGFLSTPTIHPMLCEYIHGNARTLDLCKIEGKNIGVSYLNEFSHPLEFQTCRRFSCSRLRSGTDLVADFCSNADLFESVCSLGAVHGVWVPPPYDRTARTAILHPDLDPPPPFPSSHDRPGRALMIATANPLLPPPSRKGGGV